mgnify:CR=1 FL=1
MKSKALRKLYLDFFASKDHKIVPSAPIVVKNDPTLMFTNAGMNQFKHIFLGNTSLDYVRAANSQKCLRVSGKHNDLEEVGHDTYHHTMFEMLGSWSFGDYFKKEAIDWAWEFLTEVCKLDKDRLYVTVFKGDKADSLSIDSEAYNFWKKHVDEEKIIEGDKKDNFWEMGSTGPCGPCSEIHYDNRSTEERLKVKGQDLVNKDHPQVIEIWNLVFMQFSRSENGVLMPLSSMHVDTGMGFERLAMILQGVNSSYDSDIFQPLIQLVAKKAHCKYGENDSKDIAIRVISDHIRAISFAIADGQLPSNVKGGYVIRRILRRAIRYAYTFLDIKNPFLYELVEVLVNQLGDYYQELAKQKELISKVIKDEEISFLRTLDDGLKIINEIIKQSNGTVAGEEVFNLYDRFGFPVDLTTLILNEHGVTFDLEVFNQKMQDQKERSKKASKLNQGDWHILLEDEKEEFVGYKHLETTIRITRYRIIESNKGTQFELIFNLTPFYPEGGGQIGDIGTIKSENEKIDILNTIKENNIIIHLVDSLPSRLNDDFIACVDSFRRKSISRNHTATHLLHESLRSILGEHVTQKGSLVTDKHLRFDFSHFSKLEYSEIKRIETDVNTKILSNFSLEEHIDIPLSKAEGLGALMLFGEKYNDVVRMIQFNTSKELCGGTHVNATGEIGVFKILSESSISSGIRRVEAITGFEAIQYFNKHQELIQDISKTIKNRDLKQGFNDLVLSKKNLEKEVETLKKSNASNLKQDLLDSKEVINKINFISRKVNIDAKEMKNLSFQIRSENNNLVMLLVAENKGKATLTIMLTDDLVEKRLDARILIKEVSKEINGSGGGQPFFATAGGSSKGIENALNKFRELINS